MRNKRKLKKTAPKPQLSECGKVYRHTPHMFYDAHDYAKPCNGLNS